MAVQESKLVIVIDSRNALKTTNEVAAGLENLTKKGDQADAQMTAMSASIKSLVGYMGGILTINKAIAMADGYTQMAARIRNATASSEEYAMVQDRVLATANTTYRQLGEAQEVYLSMAGGMKSLGYQTTQTLDLVDSLSFSFTHNATRTDQAQSAMDSLSKSMAKGKIDADAWISIVTGADNVIADMAKTTGKSEAEIRKLGAEGKASLSDLIKTLIATRDENEKLANNMENSLADGFTKLSNEVTVYLGKANEATSATGMLAGGLSSLADNLEAVANTGAVLGIGYVTSALLTKGAAVKAGLALSAQRKIADQAELVSQTQLTAAEVRRTASIAQYTQMQLADARATAARMTGMQRLAYVQSTVIPLEIKATQATAAHTAATNIDTAAQELNNKVRSRGAMLLGILGGPIGAITTGVMALAAGYAYMSHRTAEANAKLEEQGKVAQKTDEELKKLTGNDKKNAVSDLTAAFNDQNEKLAKSKESIDAVLFAIRAASAENEKARKVTEDARKGIISYDEAIKRLNQMDIPTDLYEMLKKQAKEYDSNAEKAGNSQRVLKIFGYEVALAGNAAQNAIPKIKGNTEELENNETAAQKAARAQKEYSESLRGREYNANFIKTLLAGTKLTEGEINALLEAANAAREKGVKATDAMYQAALKIYRLEQSNKNITDSRNAAERERTKELEKQQKVLTASSKVQANAAKYNFAGLESKYGLPSGTLSAIHAIETGNTGKTNQVNKQSGATGGFQFLEGTAKQYGVKDRTDLSQSAEGAAKYMSYLLKLFKGDLEKAVRAYHAGEGNVQKGKNIGKYNNDYWQKFKGYTAGTNGFTSGDVGSKEWEKLLEEAAKMAEQQAELRKNLELNVADEVTRIRSKLADDLQEIDKAGYSPERAKEIKAEYQARADNDIAIAQQALKTKLDDYGAFKKTESQLLEDSFNERKFYASRDLELTKDQRDKAVALLDEQLKQEQAALMLAKETRIFQANQAIYSEMELIQKRYELERRKIMEIQDLEERSALLAGSHINQAQDESALKDNTLSAYSNIMGYEESPLVQQFEVLQKMRELDLLNEEAYQNAKLELQAKSTAGYMEGMLGGFAALVDENSKTYMVLFAAQKAFSVAQAMLNIPAAYSKAYDAVVGTPYVGPYIAPAVGAAAAALQVAQAASMKSVNMKGFATGGYTGPGGKYEVAGVVHKDEGVLTKEEIKALGGPQGFEELRKSIRRGYATGGLVADTHRVGMGAMNAINNGGSIQAEKQAQASAKVQGSKPQTIDNNLRVIMVKDENEAKDWLYGPDGEKAFLYHMKRNRSKV